MKRVVLCFLFFFVTQFVLAQQPWNNAEKELNEKLTTRHKILELKIVSLLSVVDSLFNTAENGVPNFAEKIFPYRYNKAKFETKFRQYFPEYLISQKDLDNMFESLSESFSKILVEFYRLELIQAKIFAEELVQKHQLDFTQRGIENKLIYKLTNESEFQLITSKVFQLITKVTSKEALSEEFSLVAAAGYVIFQGLSKGTILGGIVIYLLTKFGLENFETYQMETLQGLITEKLQEIKMEFKKAFEETMKNILKKINTQIGHVS